MNETDDPIRAALADVEVSDDVDPGPGVGIEEIGEEADARPEGPDPAEIEQTDESGFSVLSWARSVPEGSHLDFDARDWWDPETGGKNRLAFHLADATGAGMGYPNGLGVLVGLAELYWSKLRGTDHDQDHDADAPEGETVGRKQANSLV